MERDPGGQQCGKFISWRRRWLRRRTALFDLVHVHSLALVRHYGRIMEQPPWKMAKGIAKGYVDFRGLSKPVLYTDHSFFVSSHGRFIRNFRGAVVDHMESLACVAESGYRNALRYARKHGLSRDIRFVPNCVDRRMFRYDPPEESDELVVGFVGRVEKEELDIFRRLANVAPKGVKSRAFLAGKSNLLAKDLERLPNLDVGWNVSNDKMPAFYRSIGVLFDPFPPGIPRTTIESLAFGRLVVRIRESLRSEASLLLNDVSPCFRETDLVAVIAFMQRLRESPTHHVRLCDASRRGAEITFTASAVASRYRDIYRTLKGTAL